MKNWIKLSLALFATIALMATTANAVTLGLYEDGVMVPIAQHNNSNVDTVVGITANATGTVYWTMFSRNSEHLYDGQFNVTTNDLYSFSLNQILGSNLIDEEGYLVFTITPKPSHSTNDIASDNASIAANAFLVDTTANDAIFIPVLPLADADYAAGVDLTAMDASTLTGATHGIPVDTTVDIRYWIDPTYSAQTTMVIWTVGNGIGTDTVNVYDADENRTSLTLCYKYTELNKLDPANVGSSANSGCTTANANLASVADFTAWPSSYVDGFLRVSMPATGMAYSWVTSSAFGAAQTLLAGQH